MTGENVTPTTQNAPQREGAATADTQAQEALYAGKYHSIDALEQGYKELSRVVREKTPQVPDQYDIDLSDVPGLEEASLDEDPLWTHINPVMKEAGLSNEQAQNLTRAFVDYQMQEAKAQKEAFEALGPQGQIMAKQVEGFISKNFSPEEQPALAALTQSVDGLKVLGKIAGMAGEKTVPEASAGAASSVDALKEKALSMLSDPDMTYNRNKQEAYNKIWQDIVSMQK